MRTGKKYLVERIIERRETPLQDCTWEPSDNLTQELIRSYEKPKIIIIKQKKVCKQFACGVISALYVSMDLEIWRYFMNRRGNKSQNGGHLFTSLSIEGIMSEHSDGIAVHLLINVKPVLSWSPFHLIISYFSNGKVYKAQQFPLDKLCITIVKRPCNINNL
ncbi:hypothetical protein P5673_022259 [Acropora cervicornis]|uniref:Chromo domain-containing protein n=1 Tax=Acropora cervicornis TaxID=6130 RepID=A0AAD9Q751_ACRCE|nr:hypothetical protein P5673_022259 [Acropora cervicornis]